MSKSDLGGKASEMMRKALTLGVGAIFLSEEAIRSLLGELKLPKEFLSGTLDLAQKSRKEFLEVFAKEVLSKLSDKIDVRSAMLDLIRGHEFQFEVRVRVREREESKRSKSQDGDASKDSS